ncbi:MAG: hypothetical protein GY795_01745 [Desulfobacterales bacterium]|nr:hypothetical protein [Desulfobacterales bacterium]
MKNISLVYLLLLSITCTSYTLTFAQNDLDDNLIIWAYHLREENPKLFHD